MALRKYKKLFDSVLKHFKLSTGLSIEKDDYKNRYTIVELITTEGKRFGSKKNIDKLVDEYTLSLNSINNNNDLFVASGLINNPLKWYVEMVKIYDDSTLQNLLTDSEKNSYSEKFSELQKDYGGIIISLINRSYGDNIFYINKNLKRILPDMKSAFSNEDITAKINDAMNEKVQKYVYGKIKDDCLLLKLSSFKSAKCYKTNLTEEELERIGKAYIRVKDTLIDSETKFGLSFDEKKKEMEGYFNHLFPDDSKTESI